MPIPHSSSFLDIDKVSYRYPRSQNYALQELNLTLTRGEVLGLLGPNGAGKTTLVSAIVGFTKLESGSIKVDGKAATLGRRDIALVPQEYAFYDNLSVIENLNYFAGILAAKQKTSEVVRECKLDSLLNKRANALSGGEKRRLNLAITLLQDPQLLILDEPTANVDPLSRQHIVQTLRVLNARGVTIIYTSHLLDEVQALCTQIALINKGQLTLAGALSEVLQSAEQEQLRIQVDTAKPHQIEQLEKAWPEMKIEAASLVFANLVSADQGLQILNKVRKIGLNIKYFEFSHRSLEDLYLSNTRDNHAREGTRHS